MMLPPAFGNKGFPRSVHGPRIAGYARCLLSSRTCSLRFLGPTGIGTSTLSSPPAVGLFALVLRHPGVVSASNRNRVVGAVLAVLLWGACSPSRVERRVHKDVPTTATGGQWDLPPTTTTRDCSVPPELLHLDRSEERRVGK